MLQYINRIFTYIIFVLGGKCDISYYFDFMYILEKAKEKNDKRLINQSNTKFKKSLQL